MRLVPRWTTRFAIDEIVVGIGVDFESVESDVVASIFLHFVLEQCLPLPVSQVARIQYMVATT
jgi:hypothetical protein